jgi:hypothetical protein
MGYLELGDIDRKRYDVPERVEFLHHRFGMRSIKALRRFTGYEYEMMTELAAGVPKVDPETSEQVMRDVLDREGNPVYQEDGVTPKREPVIIHDEDALAAFIWLILWDAGHRIEWDIFNPHFDGLRLSLGDGEDEESGKAPEEPSTSATT